MSLKERISRRRKALKLSQGALGALVGVSQPTVSEWEKGNFAPTREVMVKLAQALQITPVELEFGEAAPLPPGETITEAPMLSRHDMPLDVPVYGTAVGGSIGDFQLNGQVVDYIRRPPSLARSRNAFAIFYANDSMWPRYEAGDPIYINPARHPAAGDDVLIELHAKDGGEPGAAYVKRLVRRSPSFIIVEQFNPARADIKIELAKIRNLWRIVPPKELLAV
jgi:phage repressor protein C with HTH and peptisase S24 domain